MHGIEHAVGIYIGLLLIACLVAIASKLVTRLPYTIFLVLTGLAVGLFHFGPHIAETGFGHELIFFVFLPPLLFMGAFHMDLDRFLKNLAPIACFAVPGVLVSTLLVGGMLWWLGGITSLLVALLFGALISPTDPVSVLALFKEADVPDDLRTMVEGESLFNDATGVVIFSILLDAVLKGEGLGLGESVWTFVKVSAGGLMLGGLLGLAAFAVLRRLNDHLLENAICLVLAYGAFWLGEVAGVSGVIATVMAGLLIGNHGKRLAMSEKTTETVETFFESIEFLINSVLFILIGLELREVPSVCAVDPWRLLVVAIAAMLVGRAVVVYTFYWGLNRVGRKRPASWKHILFWGGLRGSIPIALLLHLPAVDALPAGNILIELRPVLLMAGFGCVFFSLVVQGLTMKPLMKVTLVEKEERKRDGSGCIRWG
ncbi:MAG: sodium:proton antiporter [Kiritimatiellae bacterium]|nr:sodium:proton antiporter [Kiritimatiellia bacterium]